AFERREHRQSLRGLLAGMSLLRRGRGRRGPRDPQLRERIEERSTRTMTLQRRTLLKIAGAAGVAAASGEARAMAGDPKGGGESAMLVDTTLCVGCRACEGACSEANLLAPPPED